VRRFGQDALHGRLKALLSLNCYSRSALRASPLAAIK
jgi:hypothetical protein